MKLQFIIEIMYMICLYSKIHNHNHVNESFTSNNNNNNNNNIISNVTKVVSNKKKKF